ncbi:DUF4249 family protein [Parabacteroides faecis]|uniref:DUF4249 domain-containing protein n=1 Tax=Parabacteroides faecis TaxID=1217282 RepID=A0ABR6KN17_9BACT|nr:DUF4249 family protein [Parabacteroides faecis]MBB4622866.1 hypothetical protein [Parabacteroides faecis]GGJ94347.1 hypothetical protein GCM10007084_17490 [Parabacteroides faecis]
MKKHLFILLLLGIVLFSACENEIPFNDKYQKPQLLMNAILEAEKEENEVQLYIIDSEKMTLVSNGSVTVYVNNEKKEVAKSKIVLWNSSDSMKVCRLQTIFHPGDHVRLEATAEDGQYNAWAEVEIPQPIEKIIRIDTLLTKIKIGYYMADCIRYRITFDDLPGKRNYYQLAIGEKSYTVDLKTGIRDSLPFDISYPEIINQEDIVLTDGHLTTADDDEFGILDMTIQNVRNIFTDSRFENGSYTLNVYTRFYDFNNRYEAVRIQTDAIIHLLSITKADYRYMRAMNCLDSENYNDTFMEPVIVPQNVTGGLGFVGASSEVQMKVQILDRPPIW